MDDLLIKGGTVVDGTGASAVRGDVAVADGRIVEVGPDLDRSAHRTVDAEGCVVTPGFVDVHTHLDAQLGWDRNGTSSCWHGVTSIVMGNCGVTFAPVKPQDTHFLAELMEAVEDIPAESILDGLPFSWESYGGYLDWLGSEPLGLNVGGLVGHVAVRYHAMGEDGFQEAPPSADQLAAMCEVVDQAMAEGALGFSTSRTLRHTTTDGRLIPGTWAPHDELVALAEVVGRHDGILGCAPRFDGEGPSEPRVEEELRWMAEASKRSGCNLTFNLTQTEAQGDHWRLAIELAEKANADGARIRPQTTCRGIGVLFGLEGMTPFDAFPSWAAIKDRPVAEKLAAFRDPVRREALVTEPTSPSSDSMRRFFVVNDGERTARYDADPARSLTAIAESRGVSPAEAYVDLCLETDGELVLAWPILNQELARVEEMLHEPVVMMGLADAGAHVGQILDASQPTFWLSYWWQERGAFPLEEAIRRITSDTAGYAGLTDRGVLRAGAWADVNVIDPEALRLPPPTFAHDLPGGAGRWVQKGEGYRITAVNGVVAVEDGELTGEMPGQVLRRP
jgi:N-acyl-D-aspartate/D-glutamate deacylase